MIIDTIYIIGMLIALLGFILFLLSETRIRIIDKEIKKQNQLHKSFMKANKMTKTILIISILLLNSCSSAKFDSFDPTTSTLKWILTSDKK
jgi:hypothetical protein